MKGYMPDVEIVVENIELLNAVLCGDWKEVELGGDLELEDCLREMNALFAYQSKLAAICNDPKQDKTLAKDAARIAHLKGIIHVRELGALKRIFERKEFVEGVDPAHRKAERDALKVDIERQLERQVQLAIELCRRAEKENPSGTPLPVLIERAVKEMEAGMSPAKREMMVVLGWIMTEETAENLAAEVDAASRQRQLPLG